MFEAAPPRFPRARRSDQRSSHAAAAEIEITGSAKKVRKFCLDAVCRFPGRTTRELATACGLGEAGIHDMGRRLQELARDGEIRRHDSDAVPPPERCTIGNRLATRWYPK